MSYFKDIDYKGLSNQTNNKHKLTKIFSKDTFLCKNFLSKGKLPDISIKKLSSSGPGPSPISISKLKKGPELT